MPEKSPREISEIVSKLIKKYGGYIQSTNGEHTVQLGDEKSPVYSQGGCDCGCSPEFQFFYDGKKLAILPCSLILTHSNWELSPADRWKMMKELRTEIALEEIYFVFRGEAIPYFLQEHMRR
jgi:hypothetical protein